MHLTKASLLFLYFSILLVSFLPRRGVRQLVVTILGTVLVVPHEFRLTRGTLTYFRLR